jgi:hypothetical protein
LGDGVLEETRSDSSEQINGKRVGGTVSTVPFWFLGKGDKETDLTQRAQRSER